MSTSRDKTSLLFVLALLGSLVAPSGAEICSLAPTPAATLLIPLVRVDLDTCQGEVTSTVTVLNTLPESVLAHVTLWSAWSVPVLSFDIYLTGYDVETIDMIDLLCAGNIPATGSAVSPHGSLSGDPVLYPSCNDTTVPGDPPVYPSPAISAPFLAHLQAWLTGQESPTTANCAGPTDSDSAAYGYVTVDVTDDCTLLFPSDPGYVSVLSDVNALTGDYVYVDPDAGTSVAVPAVHVEASDGYFSAGERTFYGRYVGGDASDAREPLPSLFAVRNTDRLPASSVGLAYWRESTDAASPVTCGDVPDWSPLSPMQTVFFDEEENAVTAEVSADDEFGILIPGSDFTSPFANGWMRFDLGPSAQAWLSTFYQDQGGPVAGLPAAPLRSVCSDGLFSDGFESGGTGSWSSTVP